MNPDLADSFAQLKLLKLISLFDQMHGFIYTILGNIFHFQFISESL
jgi:hypothetical protein